MNLSGATGPTIECTILGEPDYTKNHVEILSGVTKRLKESGFPLKGQWELLSSSSSKSGAGVITTIRMIDRVWREHNSTQIGLTLESGGDIIVGREYFHIAGIPIGSHKSPGEAILSYNTLRNWYKRLNKGTHFITSDGAIQTKPSSMTAGEFISSFSPGIPNPLVEFGNFYYTPQELITSVNEKMGISIKGGEGLYGLFSNSGKAAQVLGGIGAMFGKIYVGNSFWEPQFIDLTGDRGKAQVLEDNGITIPDSAVSSTREIDYSSGFTWNATKITKRPGRYKVDREDDDNKDSAIDVFTSKSKILMGSNSLGGSIDIEEIFGDWSKKDWAWSYLRETQWAREYGMALAIQKAGTAAGFDAEKFFEDLYGVSGYKFYTQISKYEDEDFLLLAADKFGLKATELKFGGLVGKQKYCRQYWLNKNRWWYAATMNNESDRRSNNKLPSSGDVTASGVDSFDMYGNGTYGCPFSSFGSRLTNLGSKTWYAEPSGAEINFMAGDANWKSSVFAGVDPEKVQGNSVADVLYASNGARINSLNNQFGEQGMILLDYGENIVPEVRLPLLKDSLMNVIDLSPSVTASDGTAAYGGIGGIKEDELNQLGDEYFEELEGALEEAISDDDSPRLGFFGFKSMTKNGVGHRVADGSRFGVDLADSSLNEEEQAAYVNAPPRVYRKFHISNCSAAVKNENAASMAFHINKTQVNHKVNYSWTTGENIPDYESKNDALYTIITEEGKIEQLAYKDICNNGFAVPYIESISFSLVNEMLEDFDIKYLESLSMNVVNGKLTCNYKFSEKNMLPDYKGMAGMRVKLQNLWY